VRGNHNVHMGKGNTEEHGLENDAARCRMVHVTCVTSCVKNIAFLRMNEVLVTACNICAQSVRKQLGCLKHKNKRTGSASLSFVCDM